VLPLLRRHNISWFASFNLALAAPMFLLVGCALFAYAREGNQPRWQDLRDRFRLHRMDLTSWVWTSGLTIFMFGGRSRVCRSVSKKHLARHHRPYCGEQRHLNWNRSWDRGLKGARIRRPSISRGGFLDREVRRPGIALEEGASSSEPTSLVGRQTGSDPIHGRRHSNGRSSSRVVPDLVGKGK
jgi:hypothetical protein